MPVKKISTAELEVGMFVSSLDRPWSETPFLFQGFPVREQGEIEELKQTCRHVYIMVPDEEIELSGLSPQRKAETAYSHLIGRKRYEVTSSVKEELRKVRSSHEQISHLLVEIENTLKKDRELDLSIINHSIEYMVDSIERNPDAYILLTRIKKYDSGPGTRTGTRQAERAGHGHAVHGHRQDGAAGQAAEQDGAPQR
jgi:hypothetical protein